MFDEESDIMKKFMLVVMIFLFSAIVSAQDVTASPDSTEDSAENPQMTMEQYEARLAEETSKYEATLDRLDGNINGFYKVFNYMGQGYIKLNVDLILQISDYEAVQSDRFTVSFSGEDDMGFTVNKKWKVKKSDAYVNNEGCGIFLLNFNLEKGIYSGVEIKITGNKGESASAVLDTYATLQLSDLKPKLSDTFFVSDINGVQRNEFFRRNYFIVPNLNGYYEKNKQFGFYFEYYHLSVDALYEEGSYTVDYKITFAPTDTEVFSKSEEKNEVKANGNYIMYLPDVSSLISGIYRVNFTFTDNMSGLKFERELFFKVKEEKHDEPTENSGE